MYRRLIHDPAEAIPAFEDAVIEHITNSTDASVRKMLRPGQRVHVALVGEFGPNHVSPRQLLSSFINQVVEVYGIVTKVCAIRVRFSIICTVSSGVGSASQDAQIRALC